MPDFTPTETRILNLLADGKPHARDELLACLWDELSGKAALLTHLTRIRRKLEPFGQTIRCLSSTCFHDLSYVHEVGAARPRPSPSEGP